MFYSETNIKQNNCFTFFVSTVFFNLPSVRLQASLTVAPTINIFQPSIIKQITQSVFEVTFPYFGDVFTDASLAGDDDVVEAHTYFPITRFCSLVFGSLAV